MDLLDKNLLNSNLFSNIIELDYNQLESEYNDLPNELPASFFDKFYNLQIIHCDKKVKDDCNLIWFLKKLVSLKKISIKGDASVKKIIEDTLDFKNKLKRDFEIYFYGIYK